MATNGGTYLTIADLATRSDKDGMPLKIAEVVNEDNGLPAHMVWKPSTEMMGNRTVIRTGLPTVSTRRLNKGITPSKSSTSVVKDSMSLLASRSHVDLKELQLHKNPDQFRIDEGMAFIESNIQKVTELVITGDPSTSGGEEFLGLQGRYNSLSGNISDNVISCGGTGSDLSSIWVIKHGAGFHGIHPMNTLAGLQHDDLGKIQQSDVDGSTALNHGSPLYSVMADEWQWDCGIAVPDWRCVARVCNVESSDALGLSGTQELTDYATNIRYAMLDALERIPSVGEGRVMIYMPRSLKIAMMKMSLALTSANVFTTESVNGRPTTFFFDNEVHVLDKLGYTETAVS